MAGRPKIEITDQMIAQIESLAAQGLSQEQIASVIGIGDSTLRRRKKDNEHFERAIKRGQDKGIATITNALFNNAKNGNLGAQVFFLKNRAGWKDRTETDTNLNINTPDIIEWLPDDADES